MIKKSQLFLLLVISVIGLYFNWLHWHSLLVGILGLALYYAVSAIAWGRVVEAVLPLNKSWSRIFGFLTAFYLSAMAVGIPVVVWKYDRLSVAGAMLVVGLVGLALSLRPRSSGGSNPDNASNVISAESDTQRDVKIASASGLAITFKTWYFILLGLLAAIFTLLIFHSRTGVSIMSPWDALSSFILILLFAMAFLISLLVFSKRPVIVVLGILIAFSYLTHLYLPVVYQTGFGGDKWRHLGAERWLQAGNIYTPSIWGEAVRSVVTLGPLQLPEALLAGNKTSYAAQWSVTIMLAESLHVDVFWVDLLLVFLLWSFFLPLILYQFGRLIFRNNRLGLLFAFLPTLFYTFQSEGAITIPVSFGHLFFFFVLLLWLYYIKEGKRSTLIAAWGLSVFFYWAYILNFFVLIGVGILAVVWRKVNRPLTLAPRVKAGASIHGYLGERRGVVLFCLLAVISLLAIPFLEIFQGLSSYAPGAVSWSGLVNALADALGRLLAYIGVIVPPDYIDQGNFLFNQSGKSLSRLPVFSYQLIPFAVSSFVWLVIAWAIYRLLRYYREQKIIIFLSVLFLTSLGSYFISWSFTEGVHILARRLNETIVFFMVLFLGYGIWLWLQVGAPAFAKEGVGGRFKISSRKKILALGFILAFSATATYASGPKLQLVTADELAAAKYIWSELKNDKPPYCVIANTWPLLALEAESGRHITTGGFPVYKEYAQPERVKIFEGLSKKPALKWIEGAFRVTGAQTCYYMTEKRWMSDFVFGDTIKLLGQPIKIGTVYIWKIENRQTRLGLVL